MFVSSCPSNSMFFKKESICCYHAKLCITALIMRFPFFATFDIMVWLVHIIWWFGWYIYCMIVWLVHIIWWFGWYISYDGLVGTYIVWWFGWYVSYNGLIGTYHTEQLGSTNDQQKWLIIRGKTVIHLKSTIQTPGYKAAAIYLSHYCRGKWSLRAKRRVWGSQCPVPSASWLGSSCTSKTRKRDVMKNSPPQTVLLPWCWRESAGRHIQYGAHKWQKGRSHLVGCPEDQARGQSRSQNC